MPVQYEEHTAQLIQTSQEVLNEVVDVLGYIAGLCQQLQHGNIKHLLYSILCCTLYGLHKLCRILLKVIQRYLVGLGSGIRYGGLTYIALLRVTQCSDFAHEICVSVGSVILGAHERIRQHRLSGLWSDTVITNKAQCRLLYLKRLSISIVVRYHVGRALCIHLKLVVVFAPVCLQDVTQA